MITKKSELTAQLLRFIGENWVTGREAACGVIDEMMEQAAERSVTELIAFFNDHYPLEIPENHAMLWQGAFLMKAFTVWDNPEQELKKYLDEFERKLINTDYSKEVTLEYIEFFYDWLTNHILVEDRQITSWINKKEL